MYHRPPVFKMKKVEICVPCCEWQDARKEPKFPFGSGSRLQKNLDRKKIMSPNMLNTVEIIQKRIVICDSGQPKA